MNGETDAQRTARVIDEVRARRAAGESLTDDAVLAAHPALRGGLVRELQKLNMIRRARQLAGGAGASSGPAHDSIPGYEILREIHRGGQGVVYHALQISTRREVAIKVMREGPFADSYDRMRFEREVRILSALKHPNIVSIHDSGAAAGLTYFVMDYIAGEPLDAHLAQRRKDIPSVLRLFVRICEAVSAAQLHGIIHRDLKPGNIRIDQRGEPHVLDFGLAKVSDRLPITGSQAPIAGDWRLGTANQTLTGQFIGSLPWASPEQAGGASGDVDLRTDVYSLGVILYQALTGCFPYPVSGNLRDVLDNIQHAAPIRPAVLRRDIDEEVETILLKCVQKDRERRYQSAADLARDLERYLAGEPIDAKRDSRLYVLRKHLTRYRYAVFAILAVMLSLIAGIVGTTRATWRAQQAEADARALADLEGKLRQRADWETYKACLAACDAALIANDSSTANARLNAAPAHLRGWEWRYLSSRLDQSLASFSVAGEIVPRVVLSPGGRRFFIGLTDAVAAVDLDTGRPQILCSVDGPALTVLALSHDGSRIALGAASGEIRVVQSSDAAEVLRFQAHANGSVSALAFSPDGTLLASGTSAEAGREPVRIWEAATGRPRGTLDNPASWVRSLAFSPDGQLLASGHTKSSAGLRVWHVEQQRQLHFVNYEGQDVCDVAFAPDGKRIAVASQNSTIKLWDVSSGRDVLTLAGHAAGINHVEFSPDGSRLASASSDQTIRIWDSATGVALACRRGHLNGVKQASFIPGNDRILSLSVAPESTFKLWEAGADSEPRTFVTGKNFVSFVTFSPDGGQLITSEFCWDAVTGRLLARSPSRSGWPRSIWISPDRSFEWATDERRGVIFRNGAPISEPAEELRFGPVISAAGDRVAFGLERGVIRIIAGVDGRTIHEIPFNPKNAVRAVFSRDGGRLLQWTRDGQWTIWDTAAGNELLTRTQSAAQIVNAAFSSDGERIATASYDGTARIYDAHTGDEMHVLRASGAPAGDQAVVWSVAFSPDGARLATGSKDRRIRIWDVATGQELLALTGHAGTVMCLAWNPDGTQLASGGFEGNVCIWDSLPRSQRQPRTDAPAPANPAAKIRPAE